MNKCDDLDKKIQKLIDTRKNEVSALKKILDSFSLQDKKKEDSEEILLQAKNKRD